MKNYLDEVGVVVAFVAFFILFFGLVTIPAGASVAGAVLLVGFISAGVGFVAQIVVKCCLRVMLEIKDNVEIVYTVLAFVALAALFMAASI